MPRFQNSAPRKRLARNVPWAIVGLTIVLLPYLLVVSNAPVDIFDTGGWRAWWNDDPRNGVVSLCSVALGLISAAIGFYQAFFEREGDKIRGEIATRGKATDAQIESLRSDTAKVRSVVKKIYEQLRAEGGSSRAEASGLTPSEVQILRELAQANVPSDQAVLVFPKAAREVKRLRETQSTNSSEGIALSDLTVFRDVAEPWCPELVVLPCGKFMMGSPKDEKGRFDREEPQHVVRIDYRLAMGRYPVTVGVAKLRAKRCEQQK
jgi:hypothetical protein